MGQRQSSLFKGKEKKQTTSQLRDTLPVLPRKQHSSSSSDPWIHRPFSFLAASSPNSPIISRVASGLSVWQNRTYQTHVMQNLNLSPHQKSLLFKSWRDDFDSLYDLGTDIYSDIFRQAPDARKLFPALANCSGDIRDSPKFSSQALKFVQVISLCLRYLDRPEKLDEMLQELGKKHVQYINRGFRMMHWDIFKDSIVHCMKKQMVKVAELDDVTQKEAAEAWRNLAVYIIYQMRLGFVKEAKRIDVII